MYKTPYMSPLALCVFRIKVYLMSMMSGVMMTSRKPILNFIGSVFNWHMYGPSWNIFPIVNDFFDWRSITIMCIKSYLSAILGQKRMWGPLYCRGFCYSAKNKETILLTSLLHAGILCYSIFLRENQVKLYCTVLYCTVLYCTVLYCTVLYCTVLYCTVLYCTVLYCTVPVSSSCTSAIWRLHFRRLSSCDTVTLINQSINRSIN